MAEEQQDNSIWPPPPSAAYQPPVPPPPVSIWRRAFRAGRDGAIAGAMLVPIFYTSYSYSGNLWAACKVGFFSLILGAALGWLVGFVLTLLWALEGR